MKVGTVIVLPVILALCLSIGCEVETNPQTGTQKQPASSVVATGDNLVEQCMAGNVSLVRDLLKAGVDPNSRYSDGSTTCLIQAAAGRNPDVIAALLEAGADPDLQRPSDGYTALMNAALQGRGEVARMLLDAGADTGIKNKYNQTAQDIAQMKGFDNIATAIGGGVVQ